MNVQLKDITVTARDGRVSHLDQVYIRGSHVRFFIVPDMLRYVEACYAVASNCRGKAFSASQKTFCFQLVACLVARMGASCVDAVLYFHPFFVYTYISKDMY